MALERLTWEDVKGDARASVPGIVSAINRQLKRWASVLEAHTRHAVVTLPAGNSRMEPPGSDTYYLVPSGAQVSLPVASRYSGYRVTCRCDGSVFLLAEAGDFIDLPGTTMATVTNDTITLVSDGSGWITF